jgi:hypothetical protein
MKMERSLNRINIVKMAIVPKAIYILNEIPTKILMTFITEIGKINLNSFGRTKDQKAKAILSQMSNTASITILSLKLYYIVIAIKTAYYWHKNR